MKTRCIASMTLVALSFAISKEMETIESILDSTLTERHTDHPSPNAKKISSNEQFFNKNQELADTEQPSSEEMDSSQKPMDQNTFTNSNEKLPASKCYTFHTMHIGLRHTEAHGVGYKDGYTTLEGFGVYDRNRSFMPFLDLRGHVFDNGKLAGNIGLGGRSYLSSIQYLLGYYCYYDVRQDSHHLTAQQVSPGIELLGNRMEYRINGYFPVGEDESHKYHFKFDEFDEHRIILKARQRRVLTGGDAEVGTHCTQSLKYDLYVGAGPYYFSSSHASSWGGKVRLLGRYKEYISLEASYSYDHLFHNVVQGTIAFNLPFGCLLKTKDKDCSSKNNLAFARNAFAPYRFEIPVIRKVSRKQKAINPATGKPWTVWFVDNTSSSDGTFESPFPTLVQAQNASAPNDMIYVFPGNGTTQGMDMGIVLKDGQKFFGSGIAHKISTTKGKMTIPAFSQAYPTITNLNPGINFGGNVLVPANGNEISGFNMIVGDFVTAIFNPADIRGIIADHNNISGGFHNGIVLTGSGKIIIINNQFSGSGGNVQGIRFAPSNGEEIIGRVSNNIISNYDDGIDINLTDNSSTNFEISNNTVSGVNLGIFWQIITGVPKSSHALISGNSVSNFQTAGILVFGVAPDATTKIIGNTINSDTSFSFFVSNGIAFSISQGSNAGIVTISDNKVITSAPAIFINGILVEISSTSGTAFSSEISNNQVTIAPGAGFLPIGINVQDVSNGIICTGITSNEIIVQTSGAIGMNIATTGTGIINIDDFSGNVASPINVTGNVNFASGTCGLE